MLISIDKMFIRREIKCVTEVAILLGDTEQDLVQKLCSATNNKVEK